MDRGYVDFERLYLFTLCSPFFVVRSKEIIVRRAVVIVHLPSSLTQWL